MLSHVETMFCLLSKSKVASDWPARNMPLKSHQSTNVLVLNRADCFRLKVKEGSKMMLCHTHRLVQFSSLSHDEPIIEVDT